MEQYVENRSDKVNGERFVSIEKDFKYLKTDMDVIKEQMDHIRRKLDDNHAKSSNSYYELGRKLDDLILSIAQQNVVKKDDDEWFYVKHEKCHEKRIEKGKNILNIAIMVLSLSASLGIGLSLKVLFGGG